MLDNRLFTIFPIYRSKAEQYTRKPDFIGELNDVFTAPLLCSKKRLLPFQYSQPSTWRTVESISLMSYCAETETETDENILPNIPAGELKHATADGYTYVTYLGNKDLDEDLPCGTFYLDIFDGENHFYSEIFTVIEMGDFTPTYLTIDGVNTLIFGTNINAIV